MLLKLLKPYLIGIIAIAFLILVKVIVVITIPLIYKSGFDSIIHNQNKGEEINLFISIVVLLLVFRISAQILDKILLPIAKGIMADLRKNVYKKCQNLHTELYSNAEFTNKITMFFTHDCMNLELALPAYAVD